MILSIHNRPTSFSDNWIDYCRRNNIPYRLVDCYRDDIMEQLEGTDGLMWHWTHINKAALLFARQLTRSLETVEYPVFPDSNTAWHFDDKIGQKYLFNAIGDHLVPTHVFFRREEALEWIAAADFPKVFKLSSGSASINVRKVNSKKAARKIVRQAFGRGIPLYSGFNLVKDRVLAFKEQPGVSQLFDIFKSSVRLFIPPEMQRIRGREKGYVYFQNFIPGLDCDYRVVVVGHKAFAMKRGVRENDFRASGSNLKSYRHEDIPIEIVKTAFAIARKIRVQCGAFDLVLHDGRVLVIEVSYAFASRHFPGYWTPEGKWIEADISPQDEMVKNFVKDISGQS